MAKKLKVDRCELCAKAITAFVDDMDQLYCSYLQCNIKDCYSICKYCPLPDWDETENLHKEIEELRAKVEHYRKLADLGEDL